MSQKIWDYLYKFIGNEYGTAGLMGNLYAESALRSNNLQDSYEGSIGLNDAAYTSAVDNGSYGNFVTDYAGYGLNQATHWSRKQKLLDLAKSKGKSVGDEDVQLEFICAELKEDFSGVLGVLRTARSVKEASDKVVISYERPKDQSPETLKLRASYGQKYYDLYAGKSAPVSTSESTGAITSKREKVVEQAKKWLGLKEEDGSFRVIIDYFNQNQNSYRMGYYDPWCAAFASAVAIAAGCKDIVPIGINCDDMIHKFKNTGTWVENDSFVPAAGDFIFYDWDDNGIGDNTGSSDHVGIVEKVGNGIITVIEGNMSDSVSRRTIAIGGKFIRGFGTPKYSNVNSVISTKSIDEIAAEVISGKWGNGDERRNALTAAGYNYQAVQAKVNTLLAQKNVTKKSSEEVAKEVIAGKWGNGIARTISLKVAGYDANEIQKIVNNMMKG